MFYHIVKQAGVGEGGWGRAVAKIIFIFTFKIMFFYSLCFILDFSIGISVQ